MYTNMLINEYALPESAGLSRALGGWDGTGRKPSFSQHILRFLLKFI